MPDAYKLGTETILRSAKCLGENTHELTKTIMQI
jgi:hypothetical protein